MKKVEILPPTAVDWKSVDLLRDVLDLRDAVFADHRYGPFVLVVSVTWEKYLEEPYMLGVLTCKPAPSGYNVRERICHIEGILGVAFSNKLRQWEVLMAEVMFDEEYPAKAANLLRGLGE